MIGDFVDAGIDILNPVQMSAAGMEPNELKREFVPDLVVFGGGVDTQRVLPALAGRPGGTGSAQEAPENVRRNVEALAPVGGFVFAAVHDIRANVPPEDIVAMWQAWQEFGVY